MAGETLYTPALADALVILGAAGVVIPVFARFRITPVIGFILVGIAFGPFGLGRLVPDRPWLGYLTIADPHALEPFAEFGIILLLFTIGLELSFSRLWKLRRMVFGLGALELLVIGAIVAVALSMLGQYWTGALALGLALAMSSTAIVLPISGTTSPVGKAALAMLLFEDIAIVPIIFLLGAMAPNAGNEGWAGLLDTLWMGAAVIAALLVVGRFTLPLLFGQAARTKSPELFLAASLLVVIVSALVTAAVGLSPIVGALLAGLLIAETDYNGEVKAIIEPFKGLALGVFLITVGMSIDLVVVWENIGTIAAAVVLVVALKAVVTGLLLRLMGARRGTSVETGLLMSSPSETTLIVLSAASAALLIQPGTAQFWQIVTAIGLTITPLLAKLGRHVGRRVEPVTTIPEPDPDAAPTIIIGAGRVGRLIAQMLGAHGRDHVMIDSDAVLVERARRDGHRAVFGDAGRERVLASLNVSHAAAVVLTMDQPVLTERLTTLLRRAHPDLLIIARARDTAHAAALYRAGATHAVPETLESSLQLAEATLVDLGVAMGPVIASIHEKRDEFRTRIQREAALDHKPRLRTRTLES